MTTRVSPTQLDFTELRAGLKEYLESSGKFSGYDFGGSGLSALLDLLAYNTHLMALAANYTLNEAYLDSAQLRSSVVSLAKPLNYLPRSRISAKAVLDVAINGASGSGEYTLPKYTSFSTTTDEGVFNFYTLDEYVTDSSEGFVFRDVEVFEGRPVKKRFIVDINENPYTVYVIPDENVFVDSLEVLIRAGLDSTEVETAVRPISISEFGPDQVIYLIAEAASGYYEITLGDGFIGKKPSFGNVVEATYLSSAGELANGAISFGTSATIGGLTLSVATTAASAGGAPKESIASVKFNAPRAFGAQDRAVTEADYRALIMNSVSYVEAISVWGGAENNPPDYGAVFIAIKPFGAEALTETQKVQLTENVLKGRSILGVRPIFVDPEYQYLELRIDVRYDPTKTILTRQQLENKVKNAVLAWGEERLVDFGSRFLRSELTTFIDSVDSSIRTSAATVSIQRRLNPTVGLLARYDLPFNSAAAQPMVSGPIITSDVFQYEIEGTTYNCRLRNRGSTYQLEIFRSSTEGDLIVVDDAGYFEPQTNTLVLVPFGPSGISNVSDGIRFSLTPADQNVVRPKQNRLIRIDPVLMTVTATADE